MNVDIKSTVENKLLDRKEIEAEVSYSGATPSRADMKQAICGKVGANPDLVVLREIRTGHGKQSATVIAHSYSNKESLMKVEPDYMRKRYAVGEEPKKEEKPKEEPKKEEPKEEPKKEEKPAEKEKPKEEPKKEEKPKEEPKKEEPKEKPKEEPKKEEEKKE